MDLENLKTTWGKLQPENQLDEIQLKKMLGKQTKSLIDCIDRNIKIGFAILFVLIAIFVLDEYFLPGLITRKLDQSINIPQWLTFLGVFSDMLIFTTFIYFVIKYYRVKKSCDTVCNLKETLTKIIATLRIYQTLFYLALAILLLAIGTGFISGMYKAFFDKVSETGIPLDEIQTNEIIVFVLIGLLILVACTGALFVFLRWGFNKLYGNYITKLKLTLQELEEIEN